MNRVETGTAVKPASRNTPTNLEMAIEACELVKTYGSSVRALDGLSFAVEAGSVFGLTDASD